jgi:hypothetical protein
MRTRAIPRNREFGGSKLKPIVWTLILLFVVYILFQVAPPLMDKYELEDTMRTEARFAAVNKKEVEDIRESIWRKVKDLEMDRKMGIRREQIKVEYSGRNINIDLRYAVEVNLIFTTYTLNLNAAAGDRAL